jgi:4-hydroxyphenylpyruvate dioxygenase
MLRPSIASMSLGRAKHHRLDAKLDQAQRFGFEGIEVFYEDLEHLATTSTLPSPDGPPPTHTSLLAAARSLRALCDARGLTVTVLQPFMHYEGLLSRTAHAARLADLALWCELAHQLGTDLILIPSTFLAASETSGDMDVLAADLAEAADLAMRADPPVRIAYEALAWGTWVNTWEQCYELVCRVDRTNFGMCVDTFNFAGRVFADPAAECGQTVGAMGAMAESLATFARVVDVRRLFLVQLVDGERLGRAIEEGCPDGQPARMTWSRGHRLFYGEESRGAYLPVRQIMETVVNRVGYEGWVSAELFSDDLWKEGEEVPAEMAMRAAVSWRKLLRDLKGETAQTVEMRL